MSSLLKYVPELSKETLESISKVFKLFQDKNGLIDCTNLLTALKELKYDQQEPVIFDIIEEVCSSNKAQKYDEFVSKLNEQLQDRTSQKSTERSYSLFAQNHEGNMNLEDFIKLARETGDNSSDEDLKKIFNFASSNGKDIPYEEFHTIMTKTFSSN